MPTPTRPRTRRGVTLIELTAAVALLAAAMTMAVQVLGLVAAEHRAAGRRLRATLEAGNAIERLVARGHDGLTPAVAAAERLPAEAVASLPGATLAAEVAEADGLKRVRVTVRWPERPGAWAAPIRLTAWVAPRGADAP